MRQPTFYLTHGGGPCFWIRFPEPIGAHAYDRLRDYFAGLLASLRRRPRAILMASAHWEAPMPTLASASRPPMLYDYYGFPPIAYELQYPAPGDPDLARRAQQLLRAAGIEAATDDQRGFDHGVFVPMLIIDPAATLPVVTLSLQEDLDPARHLAVGAALAPLRDDDVLIVGSGSSYHNLRRIFAGGDGESQTFDAWLQETAALEPAARARRLVDWDAAPGGRASHPRAEHLLPLMVAAGAAGDDRGRVDFHDVIAGKAYSCLRFGG